MRYGCGRDGTMKPARTRPEMADSWVGADPAPATPARAPTGECPFSLSGRTETFPFWTLLFFPGALDGARRWFDFGFMLGPPFVSGAKSPAQCQAPGHL